MVDRFCVECLEETSCNPISEEKTYQVQGEAITINADLLQCSSCGSIVPELELDEANYQRVYCEFRKRRSLLQPFEIKEIRQKYGISQRNLAKLLGWSHATISRYESGAIQEPGHNTQLVLLKNPENMLDILERGADRLSQKDYQKTKTNILSLINHFREERLRSAIEHYFIANEATILTGFRKFNFDKVLNAIKFFATMDPQCLKVKLMKYLWYSDFLHFKKFTVSIFGLTYVHLPLGPVPEKHDILLGLARETGIDVEEYVVESYIGERYVCSGEVDYSLFNVEELSTMKTVLEKFKPYSSTSISEYSHREIAYLKTSNGDPISYSYAMELSIN